MDKYIGKEVQFRNEIFTITEISKLTDKITIVYLKGKDYNTVLSASILRIEDKFLDELIKE